MESKRIEDKLKEYRERKEKERLALLKASKPFYERVLPNVLAAPVSKILGAKPSKTVNNDSSTNGHSKGATEPNEVASDRVSCDEDVIDQLPVRSRVLGHRPKKSSIKFQEPSSPENVLLSNESTHSTDSPPSDSRLWIVLLVLKIILWIILFLLSVEFEWGAVFVIFSAFYLILTNLRGDKRKPWEPSAYSVFNPDCHAIDGTLNAEQFEKEIRYGF